MLYLLVGNRNLDFTASHEAFPATAETRREAALYDTHLLQIVTDPMMSSSCTGSKI